VNLDAEIPMDEFKNLTRKEQIAALCEYHECKPKIAKIHHDQYVNRRWNPHPPRRFVQWWIKDGAKQTEGETGRAWVGIDPERAFNCEAAREVYGQAKSLGLA
jgi:hypothetical protein